MGYHDRFAAQLSNSLTTSLNSVSAHISYLEISRLTNISEQVRTDAIILFSETRMKEIEESIYIKDQLEMFKSHNRKHHYTLKRMISSHTHLTT